MTQAPTTDDQTTADTSPVQDLIDVAETLAEYLAEAHEADVAADHMGDQTCSYCYTIERAASIIADVRADLAQDDAGDVGQNHESYDDDQDKESYSDEQDGA